MTDATGPAREFVPPASIDECRARIAEIDRRKAAIDVERQRRFVAAKERAARDGRGPWTADVLKWWSLTLPVFEGLRAERRNLVAWEREFRAKANTDLTGEGLVPRLRNATYELCSYVRALEAENKRLTRELNKYRGPAAPVAPGEGRDEWRDEAH